MNKFRFQIFSTVLAISLLITSMPIMAASSTSAIQSQTYPKIVRIDGYTNGVSEGLISFSDYPSGRYGFTDLNGKVVIPSQFASTGLFHEGLASARPSVSRLSGYIDTSGQFIIPPIFIDTRDFSGGKAIVVQSENKYQIIDTSGKFLLNRTYELIEYDRQTNKYFASRDYVYDPIVGGLLSATTDIFDQTLTLEKTLPYLVSYAGKIKNIPFVFLQGAGYMPVALMSVDGTRKIDVPFDYYASIQSDVIVMSSSHSNPTLVCDIDGNIIETFNFGMQVAALSEKTFYYYNLLTNKSYIRTNGKDRGVDFRIYADMGMGMGGSSQIFPGYFNVNMNDPVDGSYKSSVVDKNGNYVIPPIYDYIYAQNQSLDWNDPSTMHLLMATKGYDVDLYDKNLKLLKQFKYPESSGATNDFAYVLNADILTFIDKNGKTFAKYNTPGESQSSFWNGTVYTKAGPASKTGEDSVSYVYVDINSATPYDGPQYAPASNLKESASPDTLFFVKGGQRRAVNGEISFWNRYQGEPVIIDNDILYANNTFFSSTFKNGSETNWEEDNSLYYEVGCGMSSIRLQPDSKEAVVTRFDMKLGKVVIENVTLSVPCKPWPNDQRTTHFPLLEVAKALGLSVYDNGDLIGISTAKIDLSASDARELKKELGNDPFTLEELKKFDASLATQPYVDALVKNLFNLEGSFYGWEYVEYSNTIPGYEALIAKTKDLILVTEPSKEILTKASAAGVVLDVAPFSKEGFVFLVNKDNPVDSLTMDQVKDIYSGKITNWKEVGGLDAPIIAYQRNENSGSQTIMENVFMKDRTLAKPPTAQLISTMEGLIDVIAEFDENAQNGIGYSVYYYATKMHASDKVKILKIDGISPSQKTIMDNTYPSIVNYYMVTRKDDTPDFAKRMMDYILSNDGQLLAKEVGLSPLKEITEAPKESEVKSGMSAPYIFGLVCMALAVALASYSLKKKMGSKK